MNLHLSWKCHIINGIGLLLLIIICFSCKENRTCNIKPVNLKCDYLADPVGIDNNNPFLSWELQSVIRNQVQSAYQILVSDKEESLNRNEGNIWDSKKVKSDQSVHIVYNGSSLQSGQRYWWKVRVWDKNGKVSDWSRTALWEMGLLNPDDWKAEWIGFDSESAPMLRKEFDVAKKVKKARIYISGPGYYELSINGSKVGDHVLDPAQTDYEQRTFYTVYDITKNINRGENAVGVILGDGWYNQTAVNNKRFGWGDVIYGKPRMIAQIHIVYEDGTDEYILSDKTWKGSTGPIISDNIYLGEFYDARLEKPGWDKPGYDDSKWKNAEGVNSPGGKPEFQEIQPIKKIKTIKTGADH